MKNAESFLALIIENGSKMSQNCQNLDFAIVILTSLVVRLGWM